jgi:hypothetical protein
MSALGAKADIESSISVTARRLLMQQFRRARRGDKNTTTFGETSYRVAFCAAQAKRQPSTNVYETALDFRTYCIVRKTHWQSHSV